MANLFRLIFSVSLMFCSVVYAANIPPVDGYHWGSSANYPSLFEACANFASTQVPPGSPVAFAEDNSCLSKDDVNGSKFTQIYVSPMGYCPPAYALINAVCVPDAPPSCTANSELVNGVCMCKVGFKEGLGGCVVDGKKLCEAFAAIETLSGGILVQDIKLVGRVDHDSQFCIESGDPDAIREGIGCTVAFNLLMVAYNHDGSSTSYGKWAMASPGGNSDYSCSTAEPVPPKKPDTPKCANGAPGTVNGVEVCVPRQADNGVETGGKDTTTTDDGTNTTKKENNSTTVCKDGKCTTTTVTNTTVTNNASGNATTSSTTNSTTTSQGDFCSKNPKNAQCNGTGTGTGAGSSNGDGEGDKDPSEFGGACAAGFTCKGDAIQCAMAREQHARACKMFDDPSPESLLYQAEKGKEGNQADKLDGNETVDMAGRIDTTDVFGGGSGVQDLQITVWGNSVSLPFSNLNGPLGIFGNLLVAVSFLIAVRIVGRG